MKHLLWIFTGLFITGYLFTESWAVESPKTSEIDALLAKVSKNIQSASQATAMAKKVNEKLVEQKAKEKEQLKAKVENMELIVEKMEDKMEIYAVKMIGSGIDTAVDEVEFKGPAYEAWLNYVEEGGKEDFGYFRLYIWQQK
ncbi:MAG: hypothetical protein EBR30_12355 [Cytophagia bacterium]|nr:hypothetical protein [Cytophagia bacterium]